LEIQVLSPLAMHPDYRYALQFILLRPQLCYGNKSTGQSTEHLFVYTPVAHMQKYLLSFWCCSEKGCG
ncbi:hypothetical protein, partial [Acinetobacter pittii]|uniref:hypothetical protein n=1 Tax=Acinetobacter pittii TaxID=48296 RepID=UPI00331D8A51